MLLAIISRYVTLNQLNVVMVAFRIVKVDHIFGTLNPFI